MADGRSLAQRLEWEKTHQVFQSYREKEDFEQFDRIMEQVPDIAPLPRDELL